MTHIVSPTKFKSKKAFKEAVMADPQNVFVEDPSLFNPYSGNVEAVFKIKGAFTVTNHPKRSWFAAVECNKNGDIIVT